MLGVVDSIMREEAVMLILAGTEPDEVIEWLAYWRRDGWRVGEIAVYSCAISKKDEGSAQPALAKRPLGGAHGFTRASAYLMSILRRGLNPWARGVQRHHISDSGHLGISAPRLRSWFATWASWIHWPRIDPAI